MKICHVEAHLVPARGTQAKDCGKISDSPPSTGDVSGPSIKNGTGTGMAKVPIWMQAISIAG